MSETNNHNLTLDEWLLQDFTNSKEVEEFLYAIPKFTQKNSLDHTREFLARLGNPCAKVEKIHVAGTNGKGSTCAYMQGLFTRYGCNVGLFTSPHLVTLHERFQIGDVLVSEEEFMAAFDIVLATANLARAEGVEFPTFFEFLFLMGMVIFERAKVELLILETGLGGRFDATNAFLDTRYQVLTTIGLDHCQYLGDTKVAIAGEKAGIIKPDSKVIFFEQPDGVSDVFVAQCQKMNATYKMLSPTDCEKVKINHKNIDFSFFSRYYKSISLTMSTCALYQVTNATLALTMFETYIEDHGLPMMAEADLRASIAATHWDGRMEEVFLDVFFDGAHNTNGIAAFLETVSAMECQGRRILCFSVVDDKAYTQMVDDLHASGLFEEAVVIEMEESRAVLLDELQTCFSQYTDWSVSYAKGAEAGLDLALSHKQDGDILYIVGSLYLVGQTKAVLRRRMK